MFTQRCSANLQDLSQRGLTVGIAIAARREQQTVKAQGVIRMAFTEGLATDGLCLCANQPGLVAKPLGLVGLGITPQECRIANEAVKAKRVFGVVLTQRLLHECQCLALELEYLGPIVGFRVLQPCGSDQDLLSRPVF